MLRSRLEHFDELLSMRHGTEILERESERGERGVPAPVTDELEPDAIGRATA
jgi:hypothetical protein